MVNDTYKKWIALGLFGLLFLLLALLTFRYLTTAKIQVTTNSAHNYIKIDQEIIETKKKKNFSDQQQGSSLSEKVKAGKYVITVYSENGKSSSSKTITIKARQTTRIHLDVFATSYPESVYGSGAFGLVSDASQLEFIGANRTDGNGTRSGNLVTVDQNNVATTLFLDHRITEVHWAKPGLGVAQDTNKAFLLITGGTITTLTLPFKETNGYSFDITHNGTIYVANEKNTFKREPGGSFKKVFTSDDEIGFLAATDDRVAIIQSDDDKGEGTAGSVSILENSGHVVHKSTPGFFNASWSLDGTHLFLGGYSGHYAYNTVLDQEALLQGKNTDNYAWLGNDTLLYSIDSQVWSFNIKTNQARKLAEQAAGVSVTGIYASQDKSYAYFTTDNTVKAQLSRVALNNQAIDKQATALSVFLPISLSTCTVNFVNFTKLSVLLTPFIENSQPTCLDSVKTELLNDEVDISKVDFVFQPVLSQSD